MSRARPVRPVTASVSRSLVATLLALAIAAPGAFAQPRQEAPRPAAGAAADGFASLFVSLMRPAGSFHAYRDWRTIESFRAVRWERLPPNMLDKPLPDGNYFTRRGGAMLAGRRFALMATGARAIVFNVYFRNHDAPMGEDAAVAALQRRRLSLQLARCSTGPSNPPANKWWRVEGPGRQSAWLMTQTRCGGKPCEGFALLLDERLPPLRRGEADAVDGRCPGRRGT